MDAGYQVEQLPDKANLSRLLPAITKTKHHNLDAFLNQIFCMDALDLLRTLPDFAGVV